MTGGLGCIVYCTHLKVSLFPLSVIVARRAILWCLVFTAATGIMVDVLVVDVVIYVILVIVVIVDV